MAGYTSQNQVSYEQLTHCGLGMPMARQYKSGSTMAQVMAWCLTAPNHYLCLRHQAITFASISVRSCDIHLRARDTEPPITKFILKIKFKSARAIELPPSVKFSCECTTVYVCFACARLLATTNMYITRARCECQMEWGQVGWMLADHRDGLSSSSFKLDPR